MEFEHESDDYPTVVITGPPPNAPSSLPVGLWAAGLGIGESSDVGGTPDWGSIWCVKEFEVTADTQHVEVAGEYPLTGTCNLKVSLEPTTPTMSTTGEVPAWSPPRDGTVNDCHDRLTLVRIDPNGRPWYEDIQTGERIDTDEWWVSDARFVLDDEPRVEWAEGVLHELEVHGIDCVFESGDLTWVGNTDAPWEPWYRALPGAFENDPGGTLRSIVEIARGHRGGPPPAAVTLTSPLPSPGATVLRDLDRDIRSGGDQRWSTIQPEFWLGHAGSMEVPGTVGAGDWTVFPVGSGVAEGSADGWYARHDVNFDTPARRKVSRLDETMTMWEDCSNLIFPTVTPGPIEPGYESGVDTDGKLVTVWVDNADRDGYTLVVASYADPACRDHPVLGPIIDGVLDE
jgi:hypothetical protein